MPIKVDLIIKKQDYKEVTIRTNGIGNSKIIFILLVKIIALYIKLFIIEIKESSL